MIVNSQSMICLSFRESACTTLSLHCPWCGDRKFCCRGTSVNSQSSLFFLSKFRSKSWRWSRLKLIADEQDNKWWTGYLPIKNSVQKGTPWDLIGKLFQTKAVKHRLFYSPKFILARVMRNQLTNLPVLSSCLDYLNTRREKRWRRTFDGRRFSRPKCEFSSALAPHFVCCCRRWRSNNRESPFQKLSGISRGQPDGKDSFDFENFFSDKKLPTNYWFDLVPLRRSHTHSLLPFLNSRLDSGHQHLPNRENDQNRDHYEELILHEIGWNANNEQYWCSLKPYISAFA